MSKNLSEPHDIIVCGHDNQDNHMLDHALNVKYIFHDENSIKQFFQHELFKSYQGHYIRSELSRNARIIICEWQGSAYCHLVLKGRLQQCSQLKAASEKIKQIQEYEVHYVEWYEYPVNLTSMSIRKFNNNPVISHSKFEKIKEKAGKITRINGNF